MAWIETRTNAGGRKRHVVCWRVPGARRKHSQSFFGDADALAFKAKVEAELAAPLDLPAPDIGEAGRSGPRLNQAQVMKIASAIGPRYRALVILAAYSDMTFDELVSLRASDLGDETGALRTPGRWLTPGPWPVDELRALMRRTGARGEARVFTDPDDSQLREETFWPLWREACRAAGLPDAPQQLGRTWMAGWASRGTEFRRVAAAEDE